MLNRRQFLQGSSALVASLIASRGLTLESFRKDSQGMRWAEGIVFHDRNGNGRLDAAEKGLAGICVSNGREVVKTDKNGKWRLPVTDDSILFVIKPSGYSVPVDANNLPDFYFIHKPAGSPKYRYEGVAPTGELPTSINFPLQTEKEERTFKMVLFGDPQPRNQTEIDYIAHDVVEQVARDAATVGAKFGLSLGDEMFDILSLFGSLNRTIGTVGIPWYNVVGNHDLNYDCPDNEKTTETFQSHFGPAYYAFNYGQVHFLVLNDVVWHGAEKPGYHAELTAQQLEFVKNDLAHVPKDHLLVIAMHIPLPQIQNREALYRLIEDRPHTLSFSAHTHIQRHYFLGEAEGWKGKNPHHHLNHATVCGSWWQGAPDERGIPHATMADGAPNGYSIVEFEGHNYRVMFRPASRPEWEQMSLYAPEKVNLGDNLEVVANVYAGSERNKVEVRINQNEWRAMAQFTGKDPLFLALKEAEASPKPPNGLKLPGAADTPHLWKASIAGLRRGTHTIEVRSTDMFGQVHSEKRLVRVEP